MSTVRRVQVELSQLFDISQMNISGSVAAMLRWDLMVKISNFGRRVELSVSG